MAEIRRRFSPSLQMMDFISPDTTEDSAVEILSCIGAMNYYRTVETAVVCALALSARFRGVCAEAGLDWMCWASPFINGEGLNISSLDRAVRQRSLARMKDLLKMAADAGANAFALLSGPKPENSGDLPEALRWLEEGMLHLAGCAAHYPQFRLLIEPLDRDVHKRGTLGTSQESAALIRSMRKVHPESFIVWDSAHFALQEGDLNASLRVCGEVIGHMHLCNAVLRRNDPLYGDYHIMPGGKGYLNEDTAAQILVQAASCLPHGVSVAVEANLETDPWRGEEETRRFLERVYDRAEALADGTPQER